MLERSLVKVVELPLLPRKIEDSPVPSPAKESALGQFVAYQGGNLTTLIEGRSVLVEHRSANRFMQLCGIRPHAAGFPPRSLRSTVSLEGAGVTATDLGESRAAIVP